MIKEIFFSCLALFFALDPIGVLPIFISYTQQLSLKERKSVIFQSILTALFSTILFLILAKYFFKFLGIQTSDFYISGGIILLVFAVKDILTYQEPLQVFKKGDFGVVPLGTPLLAGPCVLALSLILFHRFGIFVVIVSLIIDILITGLIFYFSQIFLKLLGPKGTKAISKITSLLIATIAVMLIRKGLPSLLGI